MSYMKEMKYEREMREFFAREHEQEMADLRLIVERLKAELEVAKKKR